MHIKECKRCKGCDKKNLKVQKQEEYIKDLEKRLDEKNSMALKYQTELDKMSQAHSKLEQKFKDLKS